MKEIITIDGTKIDLQPIDLDGDGYTGGVETLHQDRGITPVITPTEMKESLEELNKDLLEGDHRMSGIDLRARLHYLEVQGVLALDSLVSLGVLPTKCLAFSRQKKRLSVSIEGKGRAEIVSLVAGRRDLEKDTMGFGDRVKSFMGVQPK